MLKILFLDNSNFYFDVKIYNVSIEIIHLNCHWLRLSFPSIWKFRKQISFQLFLPIGIGFSFCKCRNQNETNLSVFLAANNFLIFGFVICSLGNCSFVPNEKIYCLRRYLTKINWTESTKDFFSPWTKLDLCLLFIISFLSLSFFISIFQTDFSLQKNAYFVICNTAKTILFRYFWNIYFVKSTFPRGLNDSE